MKRILSLLIAAMLLLGMVPAMAESAVEYIPAPYTVADLESANDAYFPPVVYENENGPSIGVTMVGVLKVDGLYFKDANNNQQLDTFEDWRLDSNTRAEALVLTLTNNQKASYIFNNLYCNPQGKTLADITNEDGSINPAKLISVYTPAEGESMGTIPGAPAGMVTSGFSLPTDKDILVLGLRHAVYRGNLGYDASVVSAMNNLTNQYAETAAVLNGETFLPFTFISNPISAGITYLLFCGIKSQTIT